jgi:leucyl-tRNA---protein transferase
MVYYHVHNPTSLSPAQLDNYLAAGWYRMQLLIFTTDLITKDDRLVPVFWLRLVVNKYQPSRTHKKIIAANKGFTVAFEPLQITEELELLYKQYRETMDFDLSPTLQESLLGEEDTSVYQTKCITIRDGEELIAAGIFDEGENSIAGIINFYHPNYAVKSLGKYLMLLKLQFAQQHMKKYYYSGYISTVFSKFDYKLMVGAAATEVYNRQQEEWVPWQSVAKEKLEEWLLQSDNNTIE